MTVSDLREVLAMLKDNPNVHSVRLGDIEVHVGPQAGPLGDESAIDKAIKLQKLVEAKEDRMLALAHVEGFGSIERGAGEDDQ